jgi:hypothetical protein
MPLFLLHASLMGAGFLLALSALLIAMTQRRKRWWLKAHRIVGLTGTAAMLFGATAAVAAVASSPQARHFESPHTWIGALTVALAAGASTLGLLQLRIPAKAATFRASLPGRSEPRRPDRHLAGLRAADHLSGGPLKGRTIRVSAHG